MRRAVLALVLTVVAVVLLARYETHPPGARELASARERQAAIRTSAAPGVVEKRPPRRHPHTVSATGPALTTPFSVIQVRVTLTRGRLTGVHTVALTGDGAHTEALNDKAEPILRREALRAQGADIDTVSGATYTSRSWIRSLQEAIDAAHARHAHER